MAENPKVLHYITPRATRFENIAASAIRTLLKTDVEYGFGGGLPATESFPSLTIAYLLGSTILLRPNLLSYMPTEPLHEFCDAVRYLAKGRSITGLEDENIAVTTGSQQALDLITKVYVNEEEYIMTDAPTYLGEIQAARPYQPRFVDIPKAEDGKVDEGKLKELLRTLPIKLIYLNPTFSNPAGTTMSLEERRIFARTVTEFNQSFRQSNKDEAVEHPHTLIVEDEPYYELSYDSNPVPSTIYSMASDYTVHLGTLSKILAPSFRIGYIIARPEIINDLVTAKGGTDLHTPGFLQVAAARYINGGYYDRHLQKIKKMYLDRCNAMKQALDTYFGWATRSDPQGGMFVWLSNIGFDAKTILEEAVKNQVNFAPGAGFFANADSARTDTMRLNFTKCRPDKIWQGIKILSEIASHAREQGKTSS